MTTIRNSIRLDIYFLLKNLLKEGIYDNEYHDEITAKDFCLLLVNKCNGHIKRIQDGGNKDE